MAGSSKEHSTPYAVVAARVPVRPASKRELLAMCRDLEHAALKAPPPAVALALQDARHLTQRTRDIYAELAAAGTRATLHARGLQSWIAPGVTGVDLDDDDPLVDEWVLVLLGDEPVVLAATDLSRTQGGDLERDFTLGVSHDPDVVTACAALLGLQAPGTDR